MSDWDGFERRKSSFLNNNDRDLFIRMSQNLENHLSNFKLHLIDDEEVKKKVEYLEKVVWMGMGALAVLNIFLKFIHF